MFWDLKDRFDFDFSTLLCLAFLAVLQKTLDQLIDTGSAYLEKLDDLCA
ncbi:hypothetical protein D020_3918 [Vibrio parahaemolyticus SBR10290]|nr:hypothetical protein VP10329_22978 [Vibrio parahaemolyticus 10329]EQL83305.1 hypothetical protein D052_4496 [Vibrio parahaemolyticus 10290]ESW42320.1 hypothetical protein D022_4242 [Vibrio parahaemolyticus 12310]ETT19081.1 hypothetical protein D023_4010 [Vibrio parahaemolyticus 3256]ETX51553.1 hypothetical protein D020_3918 [Vibrio parahaemolyticus SBR10290]EVU10218.1 hypothetical protein D046_8443 [Vibrio parahaemolyticus V-223/04]KIS91221.1 hypothetical protein H338_09690 [Vibrio parahae